MKSLSGPSPRTHMCTDSEQDEGPLGARQTLPPTPRIPVFRRETRHFLDHLSLAFYLSFFFLIFYIFSLNAHTVFTSHSSLEMRNHQDTCGLHLTPTICLGPFPLRPGAAFASSVSVLFIYHSFPGKLITKPLTLLNLYHFPHQFSLFCTTFRQDFSSQFSKPLTRISAVCTLLFTCYNFSYCVPCYMRMRMNKCPLLIRILSN